jgi:hypothetical protein
VEGVLCNQRRIEIHKYLITKSFHKYFDSHCVAVAVAEIDSSDNMAKGKWSGKWYASFPKIMGKTEKTLLTPTIASNAISMSRKR